MGKKKNNPKGDKPEQREDTIIGENNDHKEKGDMPYHDKDTHDFDL
ncbi:MAG: hypothetical protein IJS17_03765 [Clostridia bacterium]|nr:hypothetical protein [Clostridia bacterium]